MKVLSVQQPWASLICTGVKDVENRTWQPKEVPGRILIHASAKKIPRDYDMKYLLPEEISVISNMKLFGICPDYNELYYSSIIGYVDVVGFTNDSDSFWAGPGQTHWKLENAFLFDEPIQDVKGKLGLFDYPLDENNLPPAHKVEHNYPVLEGEHLTVHLGDTAWIIFMENDSVFTIDINDPYVIDTICKEDSFELKPVKEITFINGKDKITRKVKNFGWDAYKDADGNDLKYTTKDGEEEMLWALAVYELEK
jgi:hypothetical protein